MTAASRRRACKGSLTYPATVGGTEWGGGAVDPTTDTYVVNSSSVVQIYRLIKRADYAKESNNGKKPGYYAQKGAPYGFHISNFTNPLGMPCWNPPYGTLASYDLKTGKLLWKEPFGEVQKWGFYMPKSWGSVTIGAPVITKSGLIFIGASMDSRVRAIDLKTGKVLWKRPGRRARPSPCPRRLHLQGQAVRRVRRRRQRDPDAAGQRPDRRLRPAGLETHSELQQFPAPPSAGPDSSGLRRPGTGDQAPPATTSPTERLTGPAR